RPAGEGPFPAVVLLHGCHGVSASTRDWAGWFRERGYVALIVDSWAARGIGRGCDADTPDLPSTERFDDTGGALRFLQAQPDVGNRNRPGEGCGGTVGFEAAAFVDAQRRIEDFFGYHLKRK